MMLTVACVSSPLTPMTLTCSSSKIRGNPPHVAGKVMVPEVGNVVPSASRLARNYALSRCGIAGNSIVGPAITPTA